MQLIIEKINISSKHLLKKCGYIEITNPHTGENSFAKSIHAGRFYPRFHIYLENKNNNQFLNIHLDAKKPIYKGGPAHSGEYDSPVVSEELEKIKQFIEKYKSASEIDKPLGFKKEKPWWKKILGV